MPAGELRARAGGYYQDGRSIVMRTGRQRIHWNVMAVIIGTGRAARCLMEKGLGGLNCSARRCDVVPEMRCRIWRTV